MDDPTGSIRGPLTKNGLLGMNCLQNPDQPAIGKGPAKTPATSFGLCGSV